MPKKLFFFLVTSNNVKDVFILFYLLGNFGWLSVSVFTSCVLISFLNFFFHSTNISIKIEFA